MLLLFVFFFLVASYSEWLFFSSSCKYVTMERRFLKWGKPGNRFERYTGIHPADRSLLFHGIWPRMARCGIASFLIVGGYFLVMDQIVSS